MKNLFSILVMAFLTFLAACTTAQHTDGVQVSLGQAVDTSHIAVHASWPKRYTSLTQLVEASDLIVLGIVKEGVSDLDSKGPQNRDSIGPENRDSKGPQNRGIVYTDYNLHVLKFLKDKNGRNKPQNLKLRHTGGILEGVTYEISQHPLYKHNERVVLFLRQATPDIVVTLGPTSRFSIKKDLVNVNSPIGMQLPKDISEKKFIDMIEEAVEKNEYRR